MKKNNPRRYRVEGLGEWGISEGVIYQRVEQQGFDWKKLVAARDEELKRKAGMWGKIAERDRLRLIAGVDFGYTDPTAYVVLLIDEREQTIYVVDEIYKTNVTNQMLADQIIRRNWGGLRLICDSAEPKSIQELRDQGLKAEGASKGRDSVLLASRNCRTSDGLCIRVAAASGGTSRHTPGQRRPAANSRISRITSFRTVRTRLDMPQ